MPEPRRSPPPRRVSRDARRARREQLRRDQIERVARRDAQRPRSAVTDFLSHLVPGEWARVFDALAWGCGSLGGAALRSIYCWPPDSDTFRWPHWARDTLIKVVDMHANNDSRLVVELIEYIRQRALFEAAVGARLIPRAAMVQPVMRALHAGFTIDDVARDRLLRPRYKRSHSYCVLSPWSIRFSFDELPTATPSVRPTPPYKLLSPGRRRQIAVAAWRAKLIDRAQAHRSTDRAVLLRELLDDTV